MKILAKPASHFRSLYEIKLRNANDARLEIVGGQDLLKSLEREGDRPVAMFLTEDDENWFTVFTDGSISRFVGCLIGDNSSAAPMAPREND